MNSAGEQTAADSFDVRRLAFYALTSSVFTLVPVPLLGDRLLGSLRRRIARDALAARGINLEPAALHSLAGTANPPAGCTVGLLFVLTWKIIVWFLRRAFRTIFFWLTVKEAVDSASRTFHEAFLLHCAAPALADRLRAQGGAPAPPAVLAAVRGAIEATCSEVDPRPLEHTLKVTLRSGRRALRRAARGLVRRSGDPLPAIDDELVVQLDARLGAQRTYLERLAAVFHAHLRTSSSNTVNSSI